MAGMSRPTSRRSVERGSLSSGPRRERKAAFAEIFGFCTDPELPEIPCRHFAIGDVRRGHSVQVHRQCVGEDRAAEENRMNKSLVTGVVLGAAVITAGGAFAGYQWLSEPKYAEVLAVHPITEPVRTPRQECEDVVVTHTRPAKDQHKVTGTVVGAVVGGVLGSQIGSGDGRKIATAAGAVAGGYAGNRIQDRLQKGNTYTTTEQRCR